MFRKLQCASKLPGRLFKTQIAQPHLLSFYLSRAGVGPHFFPTDAVDLGTTLENDSSKYLPFLGLGELDS